MATGKEVCKYKLTLSLDGQFARKFAAFAGFTGEDMSSIATRAIRREMKGFQVRRTDASDDSAESSEATVSLTMRVEPQREAG